MNERSGHPARCTAIASSPGRLQARPLARLRVRERDALDDGLKPVHHVNDEGAAGGLYELLHGPRPGALTRGLLVHGVGELLPVPAPHLPRARHGLAPLRRRRLGEEAHGGADEEALLLRLLGDERVVQARAQHLGFVL
eukprot:CAMPEP_0206046956 /NCGR_PEP_ID=MMETSP1466-20131121/19993_1 /ASSEMBLY_ACC=CAM_ASM_001126 /TAXON_ID=44452 /ORGANISM="Pavlova gyrans, Strain CCMP608" /LENGTH=138 /DNA_ID=CAMNT_0053421959 /DNA_START=166 /DNA_END=578 /DNA_ORIENTATION=-